jgi:hypothetical protein
MKKILTILLTVLFSAQFATAQQTLYVYSKSGNLAAYTANKVTFGNDLFTFTYGEVTEVTKAMFSASFSVAFNSDEYKSFKQTLEVGICFSDVNESPTIDNGKIKKGSSLSKYTFSINSLDAGTTYYYRAYLKVNDAVYYGDVQSQTTFGKNNYKIINGHKFVDLGLPSGLLWATCNVGAVTAADEGIYYAWGETEPKSDYDWDTYKYGTSSDNLTKYNSTDNKATLDKEDDAAYVNWGSSCRMPTKDEFSELLDSDNCTWTWTGMTSSDGSSIRGYSVTSIKNGNSIFLPALGYRYGSTTYGRGSSGNYRTSSLSASNPSYAYILDFDSSDFYRYGSYRYSGWSVRPVAEP